MKLDKSKLSKYDLNNAKVGDKLIIANCYSDLWWNFNESTIKSVSAKRGDITLSNGDRYQRDGRKIGAGRFGVYDDDFYEYKQENITIINEYIKIKKETRDIVKMIRKVETHCFEMLYNLPEEKISTLHKTLKKTLR